MSQTKGAKIARRHPPVFQKATKSAALAVLRGRRRGQAAGSRQGSPQRTCSRCPDSGQVSPSPRGLRSRRLKPAPNPNTGLYIKALCAHACFGAVESLNSPLIPLFFFSWFKNILGASGCDLNAGQRPRALKAARGRRKAAAKGTGPVNTRVDLPYTAV